MTGRRPAASTPLTDERIAKLPGWAREHIRALAGQLSYAEERLDDIEGQLAIAKGEEAAEETNVRLDLDDIAVGLPLGAMITFCEEFTAEPLDDGGIVIRLIPFGALVITVTAEDTIEIRKQDKT